MGIVSELIELKNVENLTSEYIANELEQMHIEPLRWAIVKISKEKFTINVAYVKSSRYNVV